MRCWAAYSQSKERIDRATLKQAAYEVFHNPAAQRRSLLRPLLAGLLLASTVFAVARYQTAEQAAPPPKIEIKAAAINQPAALPDVLEWPVGQPIADSKSLANAALFKAWGAEYQKADDKKNDVCKQAQAAGLRCMTERGWLDDLRRLNLPAVLQMRDKQGQEFSATLTGLDDKSATFVVGGESRKISLGVLAAQWSGHYTLLWRKPPVASKKLRLGDYGPDIEWLGKQLAQLDGKAPETSNKQLFDETMLRQVKQFQTRSGSQSRWQGRDTDPDAPGRATDSTAPKLHSGERLSMSYILDALKKSDQQRNLGTPPTLQVAQATVPAQKRPSLFYYGLLAVVLLVAGVAIGLLRPWQAEQMPSGTEPIAQGTPVTIPRQAAPSTITASPDITGNTAHEIAAAPVQQKPDYPATNAQEQKAISFDELPAPIQREIPRMAVQLHAYSSKPGERLVYINSKRLREGDSLMPGLRLEQITPDGMIFSYKGYRFRRGIR